MTIQGLHHVQICIPQGAEEEGRAFYCQLLGIPEIPKPVALQGRGGFWLQVGDRQVHVGTEPAWDRSQTKAHVAYQVNDLDSWKAKLQAGGVQLHEGPQPKGLRRFEFRDPFQNRIELVEPNADPA